MIALFEHDPFGKQGIHVSVSCSCCNVVRRLSRFGLKMQQALSGSSPTKTPSLALPVMTCRLEPRPIAGHFVERPLETESDRRRLLVKCPA
jgi:hypothetical protein